MKPATSDALLEALMAHATQEQFVFRHCWGQRDVVMWEPLHHALRDTV
jgi:alpha-ketoglutarate-dependent taurine dioxygenase